RRPPRVRQPLLEIVEVGLGDRDVEGFGLHRPQYPPCMLRMERRRTVPEQQVCIGGCSICLISGALVEPRRQDKANIITAIPTQSQWQCETINSEMKIPQYAYCGCIVDSGLAAWL